MVNRPLTNGWAHSSAWIEWLPAEQLVEGSSPSGPELLLIRAYMIKYGRIDALRQVRHNIEFISGVTI
jgi:hypothetical protein